MTRLVHMCLDDRSLTHLEFWAKTPVNEVEVGTGGFPVVNASPLAALTVSHEVDSIIQLPVQQKNHAWKSLLLPGLGQISSGTGIPIVNILVEVAGVALMFTEDYSDVGIGVLAINHIISFSDLL